MSTKIEEELFQRTIVVWNPKKRDYEKIILSNEYLLSPGSDPVEAKDLDDLWTIPPPDVRPKLRAKRKAEKLKVTVSEVALEKEKSENPFNLDLTIDPCEGPSCLFK